jgi:hypothetical protein
MPLLLEGFSYLTMSDEEFGRTHGGDSVGTRSTASPRLNWVSAAQWGDQRYVSLFRSVYIYRSRRSDRCACAKHFQRFSGSAGMEMARFEVHLAKSTRQIGLLEPVGLRLDSADGATGWADFRQRRLAGQRSWHDNGILLATVCLGRHIEEATRSGLHAYCCPFDRRSRSNCNQRLCDMTDVSSARRRPAAIEAALLAEQQEIELKLGLH